MVQLNWPNINPHHSQNALEHAVSLEAYFEALDACVELSSSKHNQLPSSLQKDISQAILKVFSDDEYPYESSELDRTLIGGLILKHITAEAAERARDRIPLRQYRGHRNSHRELLAKLHGEADLSDIYPGASPGVDECGVSNIYELSPELETTHEVRDSVSRQSKAVRPAAVSNRSDDHKEAGQADFSHDQGGDATKIVDRPKKKGRRRKHAGIKQAKGEDKTSATEDHGGTLEIEPGTRHREEVNTHKSCIDSGVETDDHEDLMRIFKDTEVQCEHLRLQLQDFENELEDFTLWNVMDELMEDEEVMETVVKEEDNADEEFMEEDTLVNDSSDQAQQPNDRANNKARWHRNEQFQQGREAKQQVAGPDASSLITFNIKHQAAVNHLDDMGSNGILRKLSSSLEAMRSSGYDAPDSIQFTNAMLLENGDVEVHAHAGSNKDMEQLSKIRGWDVEFEKSITAPAESYAVEIGQIRVDSLNMQTRKLKARVIRELLQENLRFVDSVDDIQNIHWCKEHKAESSLVIDFRTTQQADEALVSGVFVRGKHYKCQSVDQKRHRCGRCQAFGHHENSCKSAHRCGWCSSQHPTSECTSSTRLCANCHGPHPAKEVTCPAREAHKRGLRYTSSSSLFGGTEREETAPQPQRRTTALSLPSQNSMTTTPHDEGRIRVEEDESLQNVGHVRDHQGRAAAPRHTPMPANPQYEPYIKDEGSEPTQETDHAKIQPLDPTSIRRRLENLEEAVGRLSLPQDPHSRGKRGADEMPLEGPSSHARKMPKYARQRRNDYPMRNRSHLPAD